MKTAAALLLPLLAGVGLAQQLCDQYGYFAGSGYEFNNNNWGKDSGQGSQCTYVDYHNSNNVGWHSTWSWSGGNDNVKAYPYSGRQLSSKRLVSQIGSLPTSVSWNYAGSNIRANVAYDLFTAQDPNHVTYSGDYELMIWSVQLGLFAPAMPPCHLANIFSGSAASATSTPSAPPSARSTSTASSGTSGSATTAP
jgi:xyloglucan-specific endo-beta-1,4-glucanase